MAALLNLTINGSGTVSPDLRGLDLVIGKTYTVAAAPGAGYLFSDWNGSSDSLARKFTFVMQEGLSLQANFVPNPFLSKKGNYTAISPHGRSHSVLIHLNLTPSGTYSCKLQIDGRRYSCSGKFDLDRTMAAQILVGNIPVTLSLGLTDNPDGIIGYLTTFQQNYFYTELRGSRAVFNAHSNPATVYQGKYTIKIPVPEPYGMPAGYGYASVSIDLGGRVQAIGRLPDGVAFANSFDLGGDGTWPFYLSSYGGKGCLRGTMYVSKWNDDDIFGELRWIKPPGSQSNPYPDGIECICDAAGVHYNSPQTDTNYILNFTNRILRCEGTNLQAALEVPVTLEAHNKVTDKSTNALVMKFDLRTGIFTGKIDLPGISKPVPFRGAIFQNLETGYGHFIAGQTSGKITFPPAFRPLRAEFDPAMVYVRTGVLQDLSVAVDGNLIKSTWYFGDGQVLSTNSAQVSHIWSKPGDYSLSVTTEDPNYSQVVFTTIVMHVLDEVVFVSQTNSNPLPPYETWTSAATNLQDAIDATVLSNAWVVVGAGEYALGGRSVDQIMTNRIFVPEGLTIKSLFGPTSTVIRGNQPMGRKNEEGPVRCVYLATGATVDGFTLVGGSTQSSGDLTNDRCGGGVLCESTTSRVVNCIITSNTASANGGGVYSGNLDRCILWGNFASSGGGAFESSLHSSAVLNNTALLEGGGVVGGAIINCNVLGNSAGASGGGSAGAICRNSILFYNFAADGSNYVNGSAEFCCLAPLLEGPGNIDSDPSLSDWLHLSNISPCWTYGGFQYIFGSDVDDEAWPPFPGVLPMGCDAPWSKNNQGPLYVGIEASTTNATPNSIVEFRMICTGHTTASEWDFGDGSKIDNLPLVQHSWSASGDFTVSLTVFNGTYTNGFAKTILVHVSP